ncbi:MAG: rRNA pseudouridine synthase [Solobacterium sp.]|nr:rRNA pseudouridine synthase [Solobacterium sp.]
MTERLQKVIARSGIASRRKAEELILSGKVKVNGITVREMGIKVSPQDEITVNGQVLKEEEKVYYLLNKPAKTICSLQDEKGRDTVMRCFQGVQERIFPVGRLDYDTTGLLIMTNDGDFANIMMHPRNHILKTYEVVVEGILSDEMAIRLEKGIDLEDGKTLPANVEITERSKKKNRTAARITIQEGRNREIRRMMEYFGCTVRQLKRVQYGFLTLGNLKQGEYRRIRSYEVRKLREIASRETVVYFNEDYLRK